MPDVKVLEGLIPCDFNAQCYSNRYPDLQAVFNGNPRGLLDHWNNFGRAEGRIPCCPSSIGGDPSVDVSIQFPTSVTDSVPNTCPTILSAARRSGTKDGFLSLYKLNEMKTNLQDLKTKLSAPNVDQLQVIDSKPGFSDVNTYLTKLETSQLPVQRLVAQCLQEEMEIDVDSNKAKVEESKSRYEAIKAPEKRVSYYEGWFPLFRPMSEGALFGIFAAGLSLLLFSILLFLRMQGVQLRLEFPQLFLAGFDLSAYTGYIYGAAGLGILLSLVGHFYFGWF
jgi:hypothetical protein